MFSSLYQEHFSGKSKRTVAKPTRRTLRRCPLSPFVAMVKCMKSKVNMKAAVKPPIHVPNIFLPSKYMSGNHKCGEDDAHYSPSERVKTENQDARRLGSVCRAADASTHMATANASIVGGSDKVDFVKIRVFHVIYRVMNRALGVDKVGYRRVSLPGVGDCLNCSYAVVLVYDSDLG